MILSAIEKVLNTFFLYFCLCSYYLHGFQKDLKVKKKCKWQLKKLYPEEAYLENIAMDCDHIQLQFTSFFSGIFFVDEDYWREQRRFSLRHLRDYGFGRRFTKTEEHFEDELKDLIQIFQTEPREHDLVSYFSFYWIRSKTREIEQLFGV